MKDAQRIICLHGIWMMGASMAYVKHRLERDQGYEVELYDYASVAETLDGNARKLADAVAAYDGEHVHLIGHSLGGVVALRMLSLYPDLPVARVVCMGSPLCGSRAAYELNKSDWGKLILGKTIPEGVLDDAAHNWAGDVARTHDIGVIAGTIPIGTGQLFARFHEPNDGTVAVAETMLPGARDHLILPVNHWGMLLSPKVIDQAAAFLKRGEFLRED